MKPAISDGNDVALQFSCAHGRQPGKGTEYLLELLSFGFPMIASARCSWALEAWLRSYETKKWFPLVAVRVSSQNLQMKAISGMLSDCPLFSDNDFLEQGCGRRPKVPFSPLPSPISSSPLVKSYCSSNSNALSFNNTTPLPTISQG